MNKGRDKEIIRSFLKAYSAFNGTNYSIERCPDEINRATPAIDAVASNELGASIAVEHTLVEPFLAEREDTDRFLRVFSQLEGNYVLMRAGHNVNIVARIGSIQKGVKWQKVGESVCEHLSLRIPVLQEGSTCELIPGLGFPFEVTLRIWPHDPRERDHVWVSRFLSETSLEAVVRKSLGKKLPKLISEDAQKRILLFEKEHPAWGWNDIGAALDKLSGEIPQLQLIEEVWVAETSYLKSEDVIFFLELLPKLGARRLMLDRISTAAPIFKTLGTASQSN